MAEAIFIKWRENGQYFLTKEEYQSFLEYQNFALDPYSYSGRSLIERSKEGYIMFSHRSFWEYFVALNVFETPFRRYAINGLSLSQIFFKELDIMRLDGKLPNNINISDYYKVIYR